MRIIGGIYRSRKLAEFKGESIRPTSDSARESLFNILRERISGASFLDLYGGTGAVGLEALSRGAKKVVFNDFSRESVKIIKSNIAALKAESNTEVYSYDAAVFLSRTAEKFDVIFLDPPYAQNVQDILDGVHSLMNDGAIAVYECEKPFCGEAAGLTVCSRRKYGRAHLTFFEKKEQDSE